MNTLSSARYKCLGTVGVNANELYIAGNRFIFIIMDTTPSTILQETLEYLRMEWQENGSIEIHYCEIGNLHLWNGA